MFSSVNSAFVLGIEGVMIQVETDVSDGLPVLKWSDFWLPRQRNPRKESDGIEEFRL